MISSFSAGQRRALASLAAELEAQRAKSLVDATALLEAESVAALARSQANEEATSALQSALDADTELFLEDMSNAMRKLTTKHAAHAKSVAAANSGRIQNGAAKHTASVKTFFEAASNESAEISLVISVDGRPCACA
jgi:hypothetical protein